MPDLLPPLSGLSFDETRHRYHLDGHGWLARSVTGVVGHAMTASTRRYIDSTKHIWEPRGTQIHAALEATLLGHPVAPSEAYQSWIDNLLAHSLWRDAEVLAVEHRLCDPHKSLGGSFDFLIRTKSGKVCLGDLKTVETDVAARSRKPATEQLGSYTAMLIDHYQLNIDKCLTVVAGPGATRLIAQDPDECLGAWVDCWDAYQLTQPDF
jgi:hypothetical protein